MNGKVYLVGAGPGNPDLITVKGLECIQNANVLIYDYLSAPALLIHASKTAEKIYVGKKGGHHTISQDEINNLIIEKAQMGKTVTRLKGGDPFVFGRGGEEAEMLLKNKIPFEVVPGITSAIAAPAYAGIPLTHRQFTATVGFVTGHEDPKKNRSRINWKALVDGLETIVFFMGVKNLPNIVANLVDNGMSDQTPVALIQWGTTPRQVTVSGELNNIVERVQTAGLKPPAITVVGEVVALRQSLNWFENKALFGKRILVTRAREQASDLSRELADLGAECLEYPMIQIASPDDIGPLDRAIEALSSYDWLIFTSVNAVDAFFNRLFIKGKDIRSIGHIKTAVIGPATQKKLLKNGITSDIVPETYRAESVIAAFSKEDIKGKRILLPRAREARPILPVELTKMGARVDEVGVYCTRAVDEYADQLILALEKKRIDLITFTSSSTAKNLKKLLPENRMSALMDGVAVASIGPITTQTAISLGFDVHVTAENFTIPGLIQTIVRYFNDTL